MPKTQILSTHLWIALFASGTSDADNKPAADAVDWIKAGIVSGLSVTPNITEQEVMAPMPGKLRRVDVIENGRTTDFAFTLKSLGALQWQLLFGTAALAAGASVQYNPSEGKTVRGWMKIQQISADDDSEVNVMDVYARLKIAGAVQFGENIVEVPLTGMELYSTLNTGDLKNLT